MRTKQYHPKFEAFWNEVVFTGRTRGEHWENDSKLSKDSAYDIWLAGYRVAVVDRNVVADEIVRKVAQERQY